MLEKYIGELPEEYALALTGEFAGFLKSETGRDFSENEIEGMLARGTFPNEVKNKVDVFLVTFKLRLLRTTLNYETDVANQLKAMKFIIDNLPADIASNVREKIVEVLRDVSSGMHEKEAIELADKILIENDPAIIGVSTALSINLALLNMLPKEKYPSVKPAIPPVVKNPVEKPTAPTFLFRKDFPTQFEIATQLDRDGVMVILGKKIIFETCRLVLEDSPKGSFEDKRLAQILSDIIKKSKMSKPILEKKLSKLLEAYKAIVDGYKIRNGNGNGKRKKA